MPTVPARSFATQRLARGESIKILSTSGTQVVDTWAFCTASPTTPMEQGSTGLPSFMSMVHSRTTLFKTFPDVGEAFYDNRRRPILKLVEDTSTGVHDTLIAACSPERYALLGAAPDHASCAHNLKNALASLRDDEHFSRVQELVDNGWLPDPLNIFMKVVRTGNSLSIQHPEVKVGDFVVLRAEQDCVVIMSACPMDLTDTNIGEPTSVEFSVL